MAHDNDGGRHDDGVDGGTRPGQDGARDGMGPGEDHAADGHGFGAPEIRRRKRGISWIWLVPIVAALAGLSLVIKARLEAGPTITITFLTADGLEAGKTQIRYKAVAVGLIQNIRISEDRTHVVATASLAKDAASLAQEGTNFWVVRPRLGLSGVSGLGTLLSGAYIGVDAPRVVVHGHSKTHFTGLESPPQVTQDRPGKRFTVKAESLGSLDIGSPVYFRRIPVGEVIGYRLDPDGRDINVQLFVDAPYDRYVTRATRFWNASGIDLSVDAQGLRLRTQALLAVAVGGIAFEEMGEQQTVAAGADTVFRLFPGEQAARARPDGPALHVRMRYDQSVRGLSLGAPVDFNGIVMGQVDAIDIDFDAQEKRFFTVVAATIFPDRLGPVADVIRKYEGPDPEHPSGKLLAQLVDRGLRAQLRTGNLLTGQLYVAIDIFPRAPPAQLDMGPPIALPTVPNNLEQVQQQLANVAAKIDRIPFDKLGADLSSTLTSASRLMNRLDKQVAPEAQAALRQAAASFTHIGALLASDSSLTGNMRGTMAELERAARSLRALADYLQANPEALLRGRAADPVPVRARAR